MDNIKTLHALIDGDGDTTGHTLCEHCNNADRRKDRERGCTPSGPYTWRVLRANEEVWWTCLNCHRGRDKSECVRGIVVARDATGRPRGGAVLCAECDTLNKRADLVSRFSGVHTWVPLPSDRRFWRCVLCRYRWSDGKGPEAVRVESNRNVDSFLTKQRDDNLREALRGYFT